MNYNELVEHCFFQAEHAGTLDEREPYTIRCRMGDKQRGASFDLYLSCNEQGDILAARFQAHGNPYLIAGLEWLCTQLQGTAIQAHPQTDYQAIVSLFAIPRTQYPIAVLIEKGYKSVVEKMIERRAHQSIQQ